MSEEQKENQIPPYRGLYSKLNIPVKALDAVIIVCIAVIVLVVAMELRNPGFTVTFDSRGGSDVPAQSRMYGELLEVPEPPTREGYTFTGWYTDYACDNLWQVETDTVQDNMTLYAGWVKNDL